MKIVCSNGNFEYCSWNEIKDHILKNSQNPFDDIWLTGEDEYPCLAILINGRYACVHYFLNDNGDMWQSIGYGTTDVTFISNGEKINMPANSVISIDRALECTKYFFESLNKPDFIEWREL